MGEVCVCVCVCVCVLALCVNEWDTCSSGHLCCLKALRRGSGKSIFRASCEGKLGEQETD